jgi:hypothetical protein
MSSLLESKLTNEASSFSGETSGAAARAADPNVLAASELKNVASGGRRRRRSAKRSARRSRKTPLKNFSRRFRRSVSKGFKTGLRTGKRGVSSLRALFKL